MTLRAPELDDVAQQIARTLAGRAVQKIVQPDDATIMMGLRGGWLLLSADARAGRMHLVDKPAGTGEQAPSFCMLLRKELTGLPLRSVRVVPGERAAELTFAFEDRVRVLRLFLYGASAQLQLVADGRVLALIGPGRRHAAELPPPRAPSENEPARRFPAEDPSPAIAAHYADVAGDAARAQAEVQRRAARKKIERLIAALTRDRDRDRASARR
ncbi:MAG TPA: NFACT family protein [Polyangia bacterium]